MWMVTICPAPAEECSGVQAHEHCCWLVSSEEGLNGRRQVLLCSTPGSQDPCWFHAVDWHDPLVDRQCDGLQTTRMIIIWLDKLKLSIFPWVRSLLPTFMYRSCLLSWHLMLKPVECSWFWILTTIHLPQRSQLQCKASVCSAAHHLIQ